MPTYAVGQRLTAEMVQEISDRAGAVVGRGSRTTNSSATSGTTELGVLRIDNLTLLAGQAYEVRTGNLRADLTVTTDRAVARIRHSSSGAATTSSDSFAVVEMATNPGDLNSLPPLMGWLFPTVDETDASVILTIARPTGTGTITLIADAGQGIQMFVIQRGTDPGDSGVDL